MNTSIPTPGQPSLRWHKVVKPANARLRLRLEAMLGDRCWYCGITRQEGANLEFHHIFGREYSSRKLSWNQRLYRYKREILQGLLALACDDRGNGCHDKLTAKQKLEPVYAYRPDELDLQQPLNTDNGSQGAIVADENNPF